MCKAFECQGFFMKNDIFKRVSELNPHSCREWRGDLEIKTQQVLMQGEFVPSIICNLFEYSWCTETCLTVLSCRRWISSTPIYIIINIYIQPPFAMNAGGFCFYRLPLFLQNTSHNSLTGSNQIESGPALRLHWQPSRQMALEKYMSRTETAKLLQNGLPVTSNLQLRHVLNQMWLIPLQIAPNIFFFL